MRVVLAILLLLPLAAGESYVAGEDPAGDSSNQIAPGVGVGAVISNSRTDILAIAFEQTDTHLNVRLSLGAVPSGTGGYLYRVVFEAGGASYFTCWAVQYTGNEEAATQENVLGCSRFAGTQVGPATRVAGVVSADSSITWPVPLGAIGGAGLADVTSTFADTWFRGASNCCVGSTTQSQYLWNQADRAPDADAFAVAFAPAAQAINVTLVAVQTPAAVAPGGHATFVVALNASAPADVTLVLRAGQTGDGASGPESTAGNGTAGSAPGNATGGPPGNGTGADGNSTGSPAGNSTGDANGAATPPWNATGLAPWNGTATQRNITMSVPASAVAGNHTFVLEAWIGGNLTASLELVLQVVPQDLPAGGHEEAHGDDASPRDTPLPGWTVLAALGALVIARRR